MHAHVLKKASTGLSVKTCYIDTAYAAVTPTARQPMDMVYNIGYMATV